MLIDIGGCEWASKDENMKCDNIMSNNEHEEVVYHGMLSDAVNLVGPVPPFTVEVLNPSFRIAANKLAFCKGFERNAAKTLLVSFGSVAL